MAVSQMTRAEQVAAWNYAVMRLRALWQRGVISEDEYDQQYQLVCLMYGV